MAGLHQANEMSLEDSDPRVIRRNARLGLQLFFLYAALYAIFIGLNTFQPQTMEATPIAGLNWAVLSGMGLIVIAVAMAIVYGFLCRSGRTAS